MKPPVLQSGLALIVLGACTVVGPDHVPPEVDLDPAWREEGPGLSAEEADLAAWWREFGDPKLASLVERALAGNLEVAAAVARILEARALRGATGAGLWPEADLRASFRREQDSLSTAFSRFGAIRTSELLSLGLDASWEIDLFGHVARETEAADAELHGRVESWRDARVSLAGECALRYVELRTAQERRRVARDNIAIQERTVALARARFDAGLVAESDVEQALANLAATRSRVPDLELAERVAENRLALLLGLVPGALAAELSDPRPIPVPPPTIMVGVPAGLVRRRPDIRRAEREVARETARIGAIEAELYPRLLLTGTLGVEAEELRDLVDGPSAIFGIGPSISWRLFDAGRIRRRAEAQDFRRKEALIRFDATVLKAVEEVETSMTAFVRGQVKRGILEEGREAARRSVRLASVQYEQGLSDFQAVLESERALADFEDRLAEVEGSISAAAIAVYKALGGGVPESEEAPSVAAALPGSW
jgi:multidrug efflux system outer membrane protein